VRAAAFVCRGRWVSAEHAKLETVSYSGRNVRRSDQQRSGKTAGGWLPLRPLVLDRLSKDGVGRTGFEPVTSSVSECRSGTSGLVLLSS